MHIIFASAEVSPFAKTGGLGDVCGALPKALAQLDHDVHVFMPWYREARRWFETHETQPELIASFTLQWANWRHEMGLLRSVIPDSEVAVYFVANDYLYNRDFIYDGTWHGYDDNFERYVVFSRAVIRAVEILGLPVDIVHAHDWHTALLPVYLHSGLRGSPSFADARSVFTIHNLNYQGRYSADRFASAGLHERYWRDDALEYYGDVLPMKGGIIFADRVTTVSPTYAREIQTEEFGAGLDGLLRDHRGKLLGILNGVDTIEWNPASYRLIEARYDAAAMGGKAICKEALCREAGLEMRADGPLIGIVSRLVEQKGFDLLTPILPTILDEGASVVLLGTGEPSIEASFRAIEEQYPRRFRAWIRFDNGLAHRITAGADAILMPSRYEPCGLNQMYALRYGTLPIVRLTGGLADTVLPLAEVDRDAANGFGFRDATPEAFLGAIRLAMQTWPLQDTWRQLQRNGMAADFSWEHSAQQYVDVYREVREG